MIVRTYLRNRAALPRQSLNQYNSHAMHEGGAVHLLAEGVAEHVVKADVASLYPSIMRTFQIGPACDHLGVLLNIPRAAIADRRDYDVSHYIQVLITSYAARLRKAFSPEDFEQLFRLESQPGLFDQPVESIQPRWIRFRGVKTATTSMLPGPQ